jgi:hypothetical protein
MKDAEKNSESIVLPHYFMVLSFSHKKEREGIRKGFGSGLGSGLGKESIADRQIATRAKRIGRTSTLVYGNLVALDVLRKCNNS